ncbi:Dipeptidyl peptidase IV (DPP IV) N-terminal region [Popillia japonica]|uniref:Dipeptidyl peptidase IV (DPP IV) N-terminal region n=1 Tax=Popillia japonica TaxID=7064 RepID=A0AAW1L959_POPJA
MHANVHHADRNEWRLPPDETLQVADPKAKKAEVGEEEELAYHGDEGHNWWSIIFSLLVIGLVITGIVIAIYLLGYVDELLYWHGKRMGLDEYLQGRLSPRRLPPSWISETHFVFQDDNGGLAVLDTSNFTVSLLVTNHTLRQLDVRGYQCSNDLKYVLFQHNLKSVFRQSFTAYYTIYEVSNDHQIPLRLASAPHTHHQIPLRLASAPHTQFQMLQHATFLGDTTSILIVYENDIYLRRSPTDQEDTRLTFTGESNVVYNGIPDWLYQEDVLSSPKAMWSSPDGTHLIYATFNDSNVGTVTYPWFPMATGLGDSVGAQRVSNFPSSRTVRYPRPGTPNPQVQLWILDISNLTDLHRHEVIPPRALVGQDHYLTSAGWIGQNNTQVSVVWMNRAQNLSLVSACLWPNWTCVETHAERATEDSWLDIQEHPLFAPDGDSFLLLAPVQEGSTEIFTHIKHITLTQQRISILTHGKYEVTKILAWDTARQLIYYLATEEHKPGQRHLYMINKTEPQCITCDLSTILWRSRYYYSNCTYFNALISPQTQSGMPYYVLQCEGPGLPLAGVHNARNHTLLRILYDTRPQQGPLLRQFALPKQKSFEVPLAQGSRAQVQLLLPPSWREELRDAAYPVLVEVNGRPGSKSVTEEFKIDWGTYMSSHCDVVYVRLDVRGSRGQSNRALYRHLGGVEVQDQIAVLKELLAKYNFLDKTRVGMWGWGYGGNGRPGSKSVTEEFKIDWGTYMSSHCDVVYVRLDVRGSRGQSNRALYRHLGGVEVQDQIAVLKELLAKYNFLDKTRVGMWGWGYGGYVTAMVLGTQQKIFKCGIAVSPITDWLYYNSAFTERILGLPSENYKAYVEADATQRAKNIPPKSLFILHGLADTTAPYQHGVALIRALTESGVLFRYQTYPNEGHELQGVLEHVYRSMEDFFQECLSLDTDDPRAPPDT